MTGEQSTECLQKMRESSHDDVCEQALEKQSHNHDTNDDTASTDASPTDNFFSPTNYEFYKTFKYCSLDKSNRSIRLLHVSKDPDTGRRSFTLTEERSLGDACDTYTAISYCAGDPKNTQELLVNGIRFNAFANLARAIDERCHYRESEHNETSYLLWTDQICINQSDPTERSHQVGMMYDVYANAREVAVNLSTQDSPYIDEACAWMLRMAPSFPKKLLNRLSGLMVWGRCVNVDDEDDVIDALARSVIEDIKSNIHNEKRDSDFLRGFSAVLSAFTAEWWTRAWVVQEFRASQVAVFIIGQYSVESAVLMAIKTALLEIRQHDLRLPNSSFGRDASKQWASFVEIDHIVASANSIMLLCGYAYGNGGLGDLLHLCKSRKATDARDKVYAYLGLVSSEYAIKPNYETGSPEGVRRTLIETTRQMILYHKDLYALHWLFPKQNTRNLPSWVPDWVDLEHYAGLYNVSTHKFSAADPQVSFSSRDEVLSVRGAYIGTLDVTEPPSKDDKDLNYKTTYRVSKDCYIRVFRFPGVSYEVGDQAWMLFGSRGVFMLREDNGAFRLTGLALVKDEMGKDWNMEETCEQRRINII